jgi:hypothetical protein
MDKGLQNVYMVVLIGSFGAKSLSSGGKLVRNIYGNPNSPRADKLFFLNLYKVYNLYTLIPKGPKSQNGFFGSLDKLSRLQNMNEFLKF